ncbi:hypothetical protein C8R47DRAFT_1068230 [Mycena vitilis]|nr:hypothetical protein C8R47DRAFT_1068230 [Mycena vitilis]
MWAVPNGLWASRSEDSKEYADHEDVRKDGGIEQRIQAVKEFWSMYGGKSLSTLSDVGHRISTTTAHLPVGSRPFGRDFHQGIRGSLEAQLLAGPSAEALPIALRREETKVGGN